MNEKILASVGGLQVTEADVAAMMQALGPRAERYASPEGKRALVEELVAQKLFLLDARKNLLEAEPAFQARLKQAKEQLLTEYAIRKAVDKADVKEEEARAFYDENLDKFTQGETVNASHILVESEEKANEVIAAIRRMKRRKALGTVRSVTTDNGCEFLDQERLDRAFRSEVYYTRAYASYEKGAIENCNRLVRRWYPKGTDFNQLTRRQIRQLEDWINSIHRESLNGETAYAYDSRMAQAA